MAASILSLNVEKGIAFLNVISWIMYLKNVLFCFLSVNRYRLLASSQNVDTNFLGVLYSVDDFKVFGYYSNTHVKTIVTCDSSFPDNLMKNVLQDLNALYIQAAQNPFQCTGTPITSATFSTKLETVLAKSNSAVRK